ncbi:Hypothetical predicted protein [Paramuricea clavata]|uniref:Uncharacterized protein n=1 Tax=Paramuricea clavata TaxID=317549 RepID=A0A7D9DMV7_PARCT|nr:Hypothetical predicted protein [Paramuricea clavata]
MRNKFKWCISTCKKICLTIKSAVKCFVESKGYGNWFNVLYPLVKTMDSCKPENAIEPSAKVVPAKRPKTDVIPRSLQLLQNIIKNDSTKELLQILKDDMQHSREQEMKQFDLLCGLILEPMPAGAIHW